MNRYDGLKYKEIGEILNISEKTVENQLVKALAILRTTLAVTRSKTGYPLTA
jgi:RNA polymerase sigma-70 factor, ECF subfamily